MCELYLCNTQTLKPYDPTQLSVFTLLYSNIVVSLHPSHITGSTSCGYKFYSTASKDVLVYLGVSIHITSGTSHSSTRWSKCTSTSTAA